MDSEDIWLAVKVMSDKGLTDGTHRQLSQRVTLLHHMVETLLARQQTLEIDEGYKETKYEELMDSELICVECASKIFGWADSGEPEGDLKEPKGDLKTAEDDDPLGLLDVETLGVWVFDPTAEFTEGMTKDEKDKLWNDFLGEILGTILDDSEDDDEQDEEKTS